MTTLNLDVHKSPQSKAFYSIMGKFFADRKIIKELDNQLYNEDETLWIVCIEKEIIKGFISIQDKGKYSYIDNFYVIKEYRNSNIGTALLDKAIAISGNKNIKLITRNEIAFQMFSSKGFETYRKNGRYLYMELKDNVH